MIGFDFVTVLAHVTLGTLAVAMGAVALATRKGGTFHVRAGRIFVFAMGLSSVLGALLGALKYETFWITFHAGVLGATLVTSGVLAVRLKSPEIRPWFIATAVVNGCNAMGLMAAGLFATTLPEARLFGFAAADYFFLFGMAAIAMAGDLRLIFGKTIAHKNRVRQHLLRMCIGFFIAAGSAFTGPGANAFPKAVQDSGVLSLPELIIVLCMLFWLFKSMRPARAKTKQVDAVT